MQSSLDLDWKKTLFGAKSEEAREFAPKALEGRSRAVHSGTLAVLGPGGGKDFSFV